MKERIVIIGGGILGATAAYYLADAGYPVTVVEKGGFAAGASGANGGQISLIDREEPWHMAASLESLAIYSKVTQEVDLEYQQTGGMVVLEDDEQYEAAQPAVRTVSDLGVEIQCLSGPKINDLEPLLDVNSLKGVLYCPGEGKINPFKTTRAFLNLAQSKGAQLRLHTPVTGFTCSGGCITAVQTPQGEIPADIVINAAASWANNVAGLLGLSVPVDFHRAAAFISQSVAPCIRGPVVGGGMFLKRESMHMKRHIGSGCNQMACGSIYIAQATEDAPLGSREVTLPGMCLVAQVFLKLFPSLRDLEIVRAWACVTPFTPDKLPVFGWSAKVPNFFTVAGFKGAFTTAPAVGRRVRDAIQNGIIWENGAFSPDRQV